jgi:hypothetical protein
MDIKSWIKEIKLKYPHTEDEEEEEDYQLIHTYEVL